MRHVVFALAAVLVTALLILIMVTLIQYDPPVAPVPEPVIRLSIIPVERDEPERPVDAPPTIVMPPDRSSALQVPTGQTKVEWRRAEFRPFQFATHGAIPLYTIEPVYPVEALEQAITGRVRVEFTINPDGTVSDAQVVEAEPRRVARTRACAFRAEEDQRRAGSVARRMDIQFHKGYRAAGADLVNISRTRRSI